jgi:hypothetical protein
MSANFELAYDALRTVIPTLSGFSTKRELPNPYDPQGQAIGDLANGWGLRVGAAAPSPAAAFNTTNDRTVVEVLLTREVVATEADGSALHTAVKALKADATTLLKGLESGNALGLPNNVDHFTYATTSEVGVGQGERHRWVFLIVSFVVWTTETLG